MTSQDIAIPSGVTPYPSSIDSNKGDPEHDSPWPDNSPTQQADTGEEGAEIDFDFLRNLEQVLHPPPSQNSSRFNQSHEPVQSDSQHPPTFALDGLIYSKSPASTNQSNEYHARVATRSGYRVDQHSHIRTKNMSTFSSPEATQAQFSFFNDRETPDQCHDRASHGKLEPFPLLEQSIPTEQASIERQASYNLHPTEPPPSLSYANIEFLLVRLFSVDHLKIIIRDRCTSIGFHAFLHKTRPGSVKTLNQFIEMQKALAAIEYANSIAGPLLMGSEAVSLEDEFVERTREIIRELVCDILPTYITHRLALTATEILVKEITRQNTPVLRELVGGLAEVYCLTDPNLQDNPIVYASEEFFRFTQYGRDYVIGRNCRFLQGPKSSGASTQRLQDAIAEGVETCETILNYRRDGSPFLNLLMVAPLYDNNGRIRYFIGAQMDVTRLIDQGRGLESFEQLLLEEESISDQSNETTDRSPRSALKDLGEVLDQVDLGLIEKGAEKRKRSGRTESVVGTMHQSDPPTRRYVGIDDTTEKRSLQALPSGSRSPGVFQNYLLVRPFPSLRITFTSPSLRIPGLLQSKFLHHIAGPSKTRDELIEAFEAGVSVTAKIKWVSQRQGPESYSYSSSASQSLPSPHNASASNESRTWTDVSDDVGKPRWIHCTPLVGSDRQVGVWMIVIVEHEHVTGSLNVPDRLARQASQASMPTTSRRSVQPGGGRALESANFNDTTTVKEQMANIPRCIPDDSSALTAHALPAWLRPKAEPLRKANLYRDYLRREGRPDSTLLKD